MQALTLPARNGWRWITGGCGIYGKSPMLLSLIVFSYWLLVMTLGSVPVLGQCIASISLPALSVAMMNVFRCVDQGRSITPAALIFGFSRRWRVLALLGVIYLCVALLIFGATALIDGGVLFNLFVVGGQFDGTLGTDGVMLASQIATALFFPLVMAYWFAPVLVAWHELPAAKALFFSFVACLRNWRAFFVFVLGMLLCALGMLLLTSMISGLLAGAGKLSFMIVGFVAMPVVYASFYASYRDVFVAVDENA